MTKNVPTYTATVYAGFRVGRTADPDAGEVRTRRAVEFFAKVDGRDRFEFIAHALRGET